MDSLVLDGDWTLRRAADGTTRPMAVPGDILSALVASGEVSDPYYGRNELELQWVGREDWEIERDFDLPRELAGKERVFLVADSIDTLYDININGSRLGSGENMFRPFAADAKSLLVPGRNRISVGIRSPEKAAEEAAAALPYPIPHSVYPVTSMHRNLIRKAQCMSGWDWGPCLMTGGIYDGISLLALDGPRIEYVGARTCRASGPDSKGGWKLEVSVDLDCDRPGAVDIAIELRSHAGVQGTAYGPVIAATEGRFELSAGSSKAALELEARGVDEWWPAGYGEQRLYGLVVRAAPAASPQAFHEARKRIGFRELELRAERDEVGRSMTFRVNGRDIFCKGADWIPADALPSRWTRERYDELLSSAAGANMNCIRAWGGGRYESEAFYELCDEKGLLVWQDFMFACALYPSSPAFLAEVEAEVRHQVKRLRSHPSVALWCGNNENLGALGWYPESKASPMRYIVDYDRLYEGTVGRVVAELDPDRPWWPTSPCGGPQDFADNWHGDGRGDMHFWSVWHEGKSFSEYLSVKPRFCSEFGFQSFPSPGAVASFAPRGDRNVTGPLMEHHQRHPRGNSIILETMARYFRMPCGQAETLYLSQVQQAMAIRTAVDYWRSLRPRCMGILYWQLNDVWPVSSWSSLDYDGGWKLLHYEARRFYRPLRLALISKDGEVAAVAVNDGAQAWAGRLELSLRLMDGSPAAEYRVDASVPAESSAELWRARLDALPKPPAESFLDARLELSSASGQAEALREQTFLTEPKRCALQDPELEAELVAAPDGGVELELRARKPAFYVAPLLLDDGEGSVPRGRFEDSGFHLMPGEERRIAFMPARGQTQPSLERLKSTLKIFHLQGSYE